MSDSNLAPDAFTLLLRAFNKIAEDNLPVDKATPQLQKLKQAAENSADLNHRQKDAILARIDHYMAGTYGKTKRAEHFQPSAAQSNGKQQK